MPHQAATLDEARPAPTLQTWRVLIQFQQDKIAYMVHVPTEEQQRGYPKDRLYRAEAWSVCQLQLFTDAVDAKHAKAKARQLLLEYVRES